MNFIYIFPAENIETRDRLRAYALMKCGYQAIVCYPYRAALKRAITKRKFIHSENIFSSDGMLMLGVNYWFTVQVNGQNFTSAYSLKGKAARKFN